MTTKITLIRIRKNPSETNINEELQWLGNSLGLFNLRDRDSSCFRVFITLVKTTKQDAPLSSDEIAQRLHLTRGTAVHHLTKLMESGIVVRVQGGYLLREARLSNIINDLKRDTETAFIELQHVAKEIDEKLGE